MFGRNTVFPKEVIDTVIPTIDGLEKSGLVQSLLGICRTC
jgi:hypothetical protein